MSEGRNRASAGPGSRAKGRCQQLEFPEVLAFASPYRRTRKTAIIPPGQVEWNGARWETRKAGKSSRPGAKLLIIGRSGRSSSVIAADQSDQLALDLDPVG